MSSHSRRLRRLALGGLFLAWSASFTRAADASVAFPAALREELGLAELAGPAPGCRVCHQNDTGGLKTATKPLGRSLLAAGVAGGNVPSLLAGLETLEAEGTDSDRDGVSDIDELKAATDPNVGVADDGAPVAEQVPLPETGCTLALAPPLSRAWLAFAAAALLAARRARRRR